MVARGRSEHCEEGYPQGGQLNDLSHRLKQFGSYDSHTPRVWREADYERRRMREAIELPTQGFSVQSRGRLNLGASDD